ncbi:MAG: transposase [Natronospirillum sp.]|uniref:REP-associated tyrosine transposase n=1 Tax=Natronospirillum sp. TaxID=2812955 RepID=UPI0025E23CDD|nr:transposase [Natronospirillum sp.]MCH8553438.1 transposase [Natronospirillum sp.]
MTATCKNSHRLRTGRRYLANHYYHLTTTTVDREPVFADFGAARGLIHTLRKATETEAVISVAFVVMPDHLHWLVQSLDGRIDILMRRVKSESSQKLGRPVWQKGYHDRCLRREEDIREVARYIIANPLRAGLVRSVREYPHWDAAFVQAAAPPSAGKPAPTNVPPL